MNHDIRPNAIAEKYLAELERAAADLPANRRAELLADVRSHIDVARAEARSTSTGETDDDAEVRTILSQLGDPQEIIAAALSDLPVVPADSGTPQAGSAKREAFALVLLITGGFLFWLVPVVSWIVWVIGLVLLYVSRRWTFGDKLIGAVGVALAPLALSGSMLFAAGTEMCTSDAGAAVPECTTSGAMPPALAVCLLISLLALLIFATVRLAMRTRRI
ncbi:DUF1700 domain-containing protein [Streptomyces sp. NPDC052013]|uniref:DUF1700 domain-containing protein n=1 Tax=Streptomyces sp. NPDC052013 TaxID=3365679 RepID=UPI0037D371B2